MRTGRNDEPATCSQCGRRVGGPDCHELYLRLLVREHEEPAIGVFHGVAVPSYLLQHSDGMTSEARDGQWRLLHLYRSRGLEGYLRMRDHIVRRNSHRLARGWPADAFSTWPSMPERSPPRAFAVTVGHLAGPDGTYPVDGYEHRLTAMVDATLDAWLATTGSTASPS